MKTYIVHQSEYSDRTPVKMYRRTTLSVRNVLEPIFGPKEEGQYDHEYIKQCEEANGDGMPFVTIFCMESDKVVFPADIS